ncbi:MAG: hypothetical protein AB7F40_05970 [Victivallaceae bacterium]|nr:hypothetical protein [Victivallaceae bacterium]
MYEFYRSMLRTTLTAILDRFEADPGYGFIDTKLDLATGESFDDHGPEFRRKKYIYSWIQGRGLEAMAEHAEFMPEFAPRILPLLKTVADSMENLRRTAGRVWFVMTADGTALEVRDFTRMVPLSAMPEGANYSELFYFKGLFAAAMVLEDDGLRRVAVENFRRVVDDIAAERFRTDQQPFDPLNPVAYTPGRSLQGPKMIALGGLALMMNADDRFADWAGYAARFIERILDLHVLRPGYGFMEAITSDGKPYVSDGKILGDPGHAGEFAGLAGKCLRAKGFRNRFPQLADRMKIELPKILEANFKLGFSPEAHGICKSVDLLTGTPFNSDMPWWNLPETMRAATFFERPEIFEKCDDAFRNYFVNPRAHMMAYQNRNAKGEVISTVPATPDADPGYHTNLSIIDVLRSS